MNNKNAAAASAADPFLQLDAAIAAHEPVQAALDLQPTPDKKPRAWKMADQQTDRYFEFIQRHIQEVRALADSRGDTLLIDDLRCASCRCKDLRREFKTNTWVWECSACGESKDDRHEMRQFNELYRHRLNRMQLPSQEWETGIQVFDGKDLHEAMDNIGTATSDDHSKARLKFTIARLTEIGTIRPYVIPGPAWQSQLDELHEGFPNFKAAIEEVLEPSFAIAAVGGRYRPPPLLLVGPPGVGKSHFASLIAEMLKTPMFKCDFASATSGSCIDGLAVHWGNSAPGEVFKALAWGRNGVTATAGPVGFLDEIDKVATDHKHNPLGSLYNLLEIESARAFEDQSLPGIRMDASHIRWIACANELDSIPKPIRSRFHIVHVAAPTGAETENMFRRIFAGVVNATGLTDFGNQISKAVLTKAIERFSAREFKTRSAMAIGKALARERHFVDESDFGSAPIPKPKRIGF